MGIDRRLSRPEGHGKLVPEEVEAPWPPRCPPCAPGCRALPAVRPGRRSLADEEHRWEEDGRRRCEGRRRTAAAGAREGRGGRRRAGRRRRRPSKHAIKCTRTRLDLVRRKKQAMVKFLRKDVADLITNSLESHAFGRTDELIVEMNQASNYDVIEQYCKYIAKQLNNLQKQSECPREALEAMSTLIFAAARYPDLPELCDLRHVFTERYGPSIETFVSSEFVQKLQDKSFTNEEKRRRSAQEGRQPGSAARGRPRSSAGRVQTEQEAGGGAGRNRARRWPGGEGLRPRDRAQSKQTEGREHAAVRNKLSSSTSILLD